MRSNRSQIFIFDLIFASIIIIVSVAIVLSYYNNNFDNTDLYSYNSQILNGFTETELNSLNSDEIRQFFIDGKIINIHNTLAQQVVDFYENNKTSDAKILTEIYLKDLISKEMNLNLILFNGSDEKILYESPNQRIKFKDSKISTTTRRSIVYFINNTQDYKIYTINIKLWV